MNSLESIGRAVLSLALVVGLMWVLGRWARGRGRRGRSREGLEVLARQQLSRNASIAVVRIDDRAMVLGVTESQVCLLGDVAPDVFEAAPVLKVVSEVPMPLDAAPAPARPAATGRRANASGCTSLPGRRAAARGLQGSALSLSTWSQAIDVLRERTVRH